MPKRPTTGTLKGKSTADQRLADQPNLDTADNLTLKIEAARALGLWKKIRRHGWGALTAAESGSVGGYMTRVRAAAKRQEQESPHTNST
ncbi:MAG: small, acid-soluble spore protein, alpha/beta type [Thermaerobacter sp.]|nr:small, acid-soluble spore protein, alpha/beta type [Thermaerobacter sp.]